MRFLRDNLYLRSLGSLGLAFSILVSLALFGAHHVNASDVSVAPLPKVILLPSSSLYFLKEWKRGIERVFTTKLEERVKLELSIRNERAAELLKLKTDEGVKANTMQDALASYSDSSDLVTDSIQALSSVNQEKALVYKKEAGDQASAHKTILSGLVGVADTTTKEVRNFSDSGLDNNSTPDLRREKELDEVNRDLETLVNINFQDGASFYNFGTSTILALKPAQISIPKQGESYCEKLMASASSYGILLNKGTFSQTDFDGKIKDLGKDYDRCKAFPLKQTNLGESSKEATLCLKESIPVCSLDGVTYLNDCIAATSGAEVTLVGSCEDDLVAPGI